MPSPSLVILRVQSDERLVALARAGSERPFEAIVERYRRPLLRHARCIAGEARAEDVVQQALVAAWAALQRGDDVRELRAWLHRIVHNTALNALRGQREHAELHDSFTTGGAPHDVLERRLTVRETLETLAALPERQREALLRTAIEGRSQADVARDLGLSDGAVRQLIHRARTAVRAAATALTPLPAAHWLAAAGTRGEPMSDRLAELVGAAGAAGAGATLAKAGTIAVLAGGAAAGPALVERGEPPAPSTAKAQSARPDRDPAPPRDRAAPVPIAVSAPAPHTGSRGHGPDSSRPGSGRRDDGDTSGPGGPASSGPDSDSSGTSGSGSSGSGSGSSGSSGSDSGLQSSGSGSGSSGSSGSGSASGTSGSGTSGSGTSGSGTSGSGTSGSGTSGSGSSGSGTSGSGSSGSGSDTAIYDSDTSGSGSGSSGSSGSDSGSQSSGSGSGASGSGSGSSGSGSGDSEPDAVESP